MAVALCCHSLVFTSNIVICNIGLLLHRHHRHRRVNLRRQWDLDLVLVPVDADAHTLLDIGGGHTVTQADDKLCNLLDVDDVLGVVGVRVDNLGAARDLDGEREKGAGGAGG